MPIHFASPPGDALSALRRGLQALQTAQRLDARGGAALAVPEAPSAMKPHPVYELGLDDLAAGKGLEAARPVAWRYLLVANNQMRQAAEIIPGPGGSSQFGALTNGFVSGADEAFRMIDQLPELKQRSYEIRGLRVPALYVMALWLKDLQGDQDRFIVLPPTFPPVQALHSYSAPDLLAVLRQMAARKAPLERQVSPP